MWEPVRKGVQGEGRGGVCKAGQESAGSMIPKVAGTRRNKEKFCNMSEYFAVEITNRQNHTREGPKPEEKVC